MRKMFCALAAFLMFSLSIVSTKAIELNVSIKVDPDAIPQDGTTSITVECVEGGTGYIKVIAPDKSESDKTISLTAGFPETYTYPGVDFPGGSTSLPGDYEVIVHLEAGPSAKATFWVGFSVVVPEYPLGVITPLVLCLVAVAATKLKRLRF